MVEARRSGKHRRRLVEALEARGCIRSASVRDAFMSVPRELFVSEFAAREGIAAVYRDEAILTKRDTRGLPLSSSSQPAIMAVMLEQLRLEEGMSVLEVGAGTGYNAALLSYLVGPRGRVVTIDVDPELVKGARRRLREGGYRAHVRLGDGRNGFPELAPYDRIVVTASSDSVPWAWVEQLNPLGLLEVPLRYSTTGAQAIPILRRTRRGLKSISVVCGGFMPLRAPGESAPVPLNAPTLFASDGTGDGVVQTLQQLSGDSLRNISRRARRRLLSIALTEPRRTSLGLRADDGALTLFLSLQPPSRNVVMAYPGFRFGVVTRDGTSLALLGPPSGDASATVSSMLVYGDDQAEALLRQQIDDWTRRGRPKEDDLEIVVTYDAKGGSRVARRWLSARRT